MISREVIKGLVLDNVFKANIITSSYQFVTESYRICSNSNYIYDNYIKVKNIRTHQKELLNLNTLIHLEVYGVKFGAMELSLLNEDLVNLLVNSTKMYQS